MLLFFRVPFLVAKETVACLRRTSQALGPDSSKQQPQDVFSLEHEVIPQEQASVPALPSDISLSVRKPCL